MHGRLETNPIVIRNINDDEWERLMNKWCNTILSSIEPGSILL